MFWAQASGRVLQQKAEGIGGMSGHSSDVKNLIKPLAFWP
jgi:hypothetical protein